MRKLLALVWKDVAAARLVLLGALPIYALNLAAMASVVPLYLMVALVFSAGLAFGSLVVEEIERTGVLWASLPVRRADIVFARYVTVLVGAGLGLGISLGVDRAVAAFRGEAGLGGSLAASLAIHLVLLLLLLGAAALLLPLVFRLGAGNGALAFMSITVGGLLVLSLLGQGLLWIVGAANPLLDPGLYEGAPRTEQARAAAAWLERHGPLLLGLAAGITVAAIAVSAGVARRFHEARDLAS